MITEGIKVISKQIPENNRWERVWKLAQIDFRRRYFNTKLGLLWAFINPIFRLFVYLFVFTWLGRVRIEGYGFYIFSALIVWLAFSECTTKGIKLLINKKYLINNIQFKKIDLFISSTISVFLGLLFNLTAYIIISLLWGRQIHIEILWTPLILVILFLTCSGVSMLLAVLEIYAKDITHLWSMILLVGFWTMPAIFPLESFTGNLKILLYINPVAGIVINLRNAIMLGDPIDLIFLIYNTAYALVVFSVGLYVLKRHWQKAIEMS